MDDDYEGDNLVQANKDLSSSTLSLSSSSWSMDTLSGLFKKKSQRLLTTAVTQDHYKGVAAALQEGANPNSRMAWTFAESWGGKINKVPVLIVAVTKGNSEMVTALLEAKAKTEFKGDFKVTPLAMAVAKGFTDIARNLLKHGADVNARSPNTGWLPIHFAAGYNRIEIIQILHEHGACLCAINNQGRTPLHIAAGCGHKRTTEWLMKQGVDCSAIDHKGRTAADNALSGGHKNLAAWLRDHTFDPSLASTAVAQLEQLKIDEPMSKFDKNNSRLPTAVTYGDHLGVKMALEDGEDPNSCLVWEHKRVPLLTVAVSQGLTDIVSALLDAKDDKGRRKANIEYKGDLPVTPLAEACGRGPGHITIVKKLLKYGADFKAKDSEHGSLPIHFAAANGHVNIAKLLHRYGSSLDVVNKLGQTPLHRAAWWGFRPMVEWLMDQHVDVTAEDYEQNTAGDLADSQGHKELASWILSREFEAPSHEYSYPSASQIGDTDNTHRRGEQARPSPSPRPSYSIRKCSKKMYIFNFIDFPPKLW